MPSTLISPLVIDPAPDVSKLRPMLAQPVKRLEDQSDYALEIKWDGMRAIVYVDSKKIQIYSRSGQVVTSAYPELEGLKRAVGKRALILDGEIVALDKQGMSSFQLLQRRMGQREVTSSNPLIQTTPVTFMIFDLLCFDHKPIMDCPYLFRREMLAQLGLNGAYWKTTDYSSGNFHKLFEYIRKRGMEGLIAKRMDSPYQPGQRGSTWLKIKARKRQEFLICGWEPGQGQRQNLPGAVLLGYYDAPPHKSGKQQLLYAGECGTGFSQKVLLELKQQLDRQRIAASPFTQNHLKQRNVHFSRPELIGEFEFAEWTQDGLLRQPSFLGFRTDRNPREVVREEA